MCSLFIRGFSWNLDVSVSDIMHSYDYHARALSYLTLHSTKLSLRSSSIISPRISRTGHYYPYPLGYPTSVRLSVCWCLAECGQVRRCSGIMRHRSVRAKLFANFGLWCYQTSTGIFIKRNIDNSWGLLHRNRLSWPWVCNSDSVRGHLLSYDEV